MLVTHAWVALIYADDARFRSRIARIVMVVVDEYTMVVPQLRFAHRGPLHTLPIQTDTRPWEVAVPTSSNPIPVPPHLQGRGGL